jgi:hypothetical protein
MRRSRGGYARRTGDAMMLSDEEGEGGYNDDREGYQGERERDQREGGV